MKNNAIFAKKRMIVHQMLVKNGRFGKVPRILIGALPPNGCTDGEVVGVGDSVHFAGYRSHVARAEDIIYANT